jgi:phospholipid-translocating ATPase
MSVLVKQRETGKVIYYVKGAEVVMETIMKQNQKALLLEFCEQLAMEGLRTLVFAQKELSAEETEKFLEAHNKAINSMKNREQQLQAALKTIEFDMNFIGVSGVEDKL